ncbi:uncharacterized protein C8Q71DRAFT_678032, partial [Rhodofomes roseus]
LQAVRTTPTDVPLRIVGETDYLTTELIEKLGKTEDIGWLNKVNKGPLMALVNTLRQRGAPTTIRKANTREDVKAITVARKEARLARQNQNTQTQTDTSLNPAFQVTGVRLSVLTQKLAYQHIRERKKTETRQSTQRNITKITEHAQGQLGMNLEAEDVWRGIRHRDIRRNIADFLWKCTHNAHKCGAFWETIPGYEERGTCQICGVTDSMDHILTKCKAPGQKLIWAMTGNLWEKKKLKWSKPVIEDILTVGSRTWTHESGSMKRRPRAERLWRILVTEAAFLIWKLRCERVIAHSDDIDWCPTKAAIRSRWIRVVNERLHLDMAMTHRRFGRKALKRNEVLGTWQNTLRDELALPEDWTM